MSSQLSGRAHAIEEDLVKGWKITLSRALLPKETGIMNLRTRVGLAENTISKSWCRFFSITTRNEIPDLGKRDVCSLGPEKFWKFCRQVHGADLA